MLGIMFWLVAVTTLAATPGDDSDIYEELYKNHGYHADLLLTHAASLVDYITRHPVESVLDVGCSHGRAVEMLWKHGLTAVGVDIAPTAVALAVKTRGFGRCGTDPCFQTASAEALPFPDKSVDAILSSDVLEHIHVQDIDTVIYELGRVARKYLVLKIATRHEINLAPLQSLHRRKKFEHVQHLHLTVMPISQWKARFERQGFEVKVEGDLLLAWPNLTPTKPLPMPDFKLIGTSPFCTHHGLADCSQCSSTPSRAHLLYAHIVKTGGFTLECATHKTLVPQGIWSNLMRITTTILHLANVLTLYV